MDSPKNQITDKLKQATNVLVTVSSSPSVDQLAAAIGLTLLLNKLSKHATAVFSGKTPSTIEFLQPEKTLEKDTNSLRDFIIALDKSKADKLRYKVEDQMVKIFITPYRTSVTEKDLEFSQGDFNVDVVVALGVNEQQDLDQAITSHGRILHDATVVGVNNQAGTSLGSINWVETGASSLCEMVLGIGLDLKADVLDGQMATAFLTGIVAETNRFSNEKTSSETMQLSAKLMTAGANQQLIASQLQPAGIDAPSAVPSDADSKDKTATKPEDSPSEANANEEDAELPEVAGANQKSKPGSDGSLLIDHGDSQPPPDNTDASSEEPKEDPLEQIHIDTDGILKTEDELKAVKEKVVEPLPAQTPLQDPDASHFISEPPSLSGTLTASSTADGFDASTGLFASPPAAPLLSHDTPTAQDILGIPQPDSTQAPTDYIIGGASPAPAPALPPVPEPPLTPSLPSVQEPSQPPGTDTLAELEKVVGSAHVDQPPALPSVSEPPLDHLDNARDAVLQAVSGSSPQVIEPAQALNASPSPMDLNLGDMPAVSTSPASAFTGDNTMVDPSLASPPVPTTPAASAPLPDANVASDPGLPPGLVPPDPGLPSDSTGTGMVNPTAPPPVPPPLMPPVMPPPEDPNSPGNAAL